MSAIAAYPAKPNPNIDRTGFEHLTKYADTTNGAFRFTQLCEKCCKAATMVFDNLGDPIAESFKTWAGHFGMSMGILGLWGLPKAVKTAADALFNPIQGFEGGRGGLQWMNDVSGGVSACGYAATLFTSNPLIRTVADSADLHGTAADLAIVYTDWTHAKELKEQASGDGKTHFADTQEHLFWKGVQQAISVFSGIVGFLVLAFGAPLLPAASLLAISLTRTVIAMYAHFFKETRPYEMVDFSKPLAAI